MAVIYSCAEGCILDHEAAISAAYSGAKLLSAELQEPVSKNTINVIKSEDLGKSERDGKCMSVTTKFFQSNNEQAQCNDTADESLSLGCLVPTKTLSETGVSFRPKQGLFSVNIPFLMDTQFQKLKEWQQSTDLALSGTVTVAQIHQALKTGQRKRKKQREEAEDSKQLLSWICHLHQSLIKVGREKSLFIESVPLPLDNNLLARHLAQLDLQEDIFQYTLLQQDMSCQKQQSDNLSTPLVLGNEGTSSFEKSEMVHRHVKNTTDQTVILEVDCQSFIIPPRSGFLLSTFRSFCCHLYELVISDCDGFDLIVLDPPWDNKSVKRKKSYDMVDEAVLCQAPVSKLAKTGCLIALWVTNNTRLKDFVTCELFPAWGVKHTGTWIWLKVTKTGDTITDIYHPHKKPYELLILGRFERFGENAGCTLTQPPESYVLLSVPCCLHSKKAPLAGVLAPYLPAKPRCLELFARNLWPGWTSWGMEALKHQNRIFFEETVPAS